jgi:NAD(P)-dependent dehydrogenase (short-subunit alcohol dehydrogenase family)
MKILLIGATGTIGSAVATALEARHRVVRVGHTSGDYQVDMADKDSLEALLDAVGRVDAIVCTAGIARFGPLAELSDEDFSFTLRHKLMGQVNLVRVGIDHVSTGGSFTLTSGSLSQRPAPATAAVSMASGALESFARAAALDLDGRQRVNVVSPSSVRETLESMGMDPRPGMPAADLAETYLRVVEGDMTGQVIEP